MNKDKIYNISVNRVLGPMSWEMIENIYSLDIYLFECLLWYQCCGRHWGTAVESKQIQFSPLGILHSSGGPRH